MAVTAHWIQAIDEKTSTGLKKKLRLRADLIGFHKCFPHIVNLACKAVIVAITSLKYIDDTVEGYEDYEPGVYSRDCIAIFQSPVNSVKYVQEYLGQDYQLLRDVPTRWSSTLLMISRALKLKEAIDDITSDNEFKDLHKFKLTEDDWGLLKDYQEILQEILSSETTPTLCYSIPAFQSFINLWTQLVEDKPEWENIIQPGLFKLEDYVDRLNDAHILAMDYVSGNGGGSISQ
ncbi:hypothetical protein BYT27DRAFT_7222516 [Phlegmacium glaucopus]|nr:hypothetical protein BYT27DRAFT_7222516 [Phlegmacium glaucopus]